MHDAEVDGACADIDDHGVVQGAYAVGHREGFRDDHEFLGMFGDCVADGQLVDLERLRRNADGDTDLILRFGADHADQVANEFLDGRLVLFGAFLEHAVFQRPAQIHRKPVRECLLAEQHPLAQHLLGDEILGPSDVAFDPFTGAIAGGYH